MNDLAKKWIRALRDKRNTKRQTTGELIKKSATGKGFDYCVLGMACKVANAELDNRLVEYKGSISGGLPESVRKAIGLKSHTGEHIVDDGKTSLVDINDDREMTFPEFADYIEKNECKLFEPDEAETWESYQSATASKKEEGREA